MNSQPSLPRLDETYVRRARRPGSSRDFALLFAAPGPRAALTALFALQGEILASARASADHAVSHSRLEWWRAEIERLVAGAPVHPISRELARAAGASHVDFAPLQELLAAAEWELARLAPETPEELESAAWRSEGATQWLGMQMAGAPGEDTRDFAGALGFALTVERALLDLPGTARRGMVPLPLAELNSRSITLDDLLEPIPGAALAAYADALCNNAIARLEAARSGLPASRATLRAHLVLAGLCQAQLAHSARAARETRPLQQEISTLQRLWTAWRAARRSAR